VASVVSNLPVWESVVAAHPEMRAEDLVPWPAQHGSLPAPCPLHTCEHANMFHDIHSLDDPRPQCCIEGCPCGKDT